MSREMYAVLCESESGLDVFGNPKGKPILFETIGEMSKSEAIDRASSLQQSGHWGRVKIVRLEVLDLIIS